MTSGAPQAPQPAFQRAFDIIAVQEQIEHARAERLPPGSAIRPLRDAHGSHATDPVVAGASADVALEHSPRPGVPGGGNVVEHHGAPAHDSRQPEVGIAPGAFVGVVAVDEQQFDTVLDEGDGIGRRHHQRLNGIADAGAGQVLLELGKRPRLRVLARALVRVDGDHRKPSLACAVCEPDRGASFPGPDLDDRAATTRRGGGGIEGASLRLAQPARRLAGAPTCVFLSAVARPRPV